MKKHLLKSFLAVALLFVCSNVWGESYTIKFLASGSGDGNLISTDMACSAIVSDGSDYLSGNVATATKVYSNGGFGLKLGTSTEGGTLKMDLSSSGQVTPTSVVVRAKRYNDGKATTLSLNGQKAQNLSADFADYTFDGFAESITSLTLESSIYCWIESITVNYGSAKVLESIAISGNPTRTSYFDGETFDPAGLVVTATYEDKTTADVTSHCAFSCNPATLVSGTTSVSVKATYNSFESEAVMVSVSVSAVTKYYLVTDVDALGDGDQVIIVATGYDVAMSKEQKTNNRGVTNITKMGNSCITSENTQVLTLGKTSDGTFTFFDGTGYLYAASSSSNYLRTQESNDKNGKWVISIAADGTASIVAQGTNKNNVMKYNSTNVLISCYSADSYQKDVSLYQMGLARSISSYGVATFCAPYAVRVPQGVTAYKAVAKDDTSIATVPIADGIIPANTGVIICGTEGSDTFPVTTETSTFDFSDNLLQGVIEKTAYDAVEGYDGANTYYAMTVVNGEVQFCKVTAGSYAANTAFICLSGASSSNSLRIDGATMVEQMLQENEDDAIYDLLGRRVETVTKGIYIINGKKVMVK